MLIQIVLSKSKMVIDALKMMEMTIKKDNNNFSV